MTPRWALALAATQLLCHSRAAVSADVYTFPVKSVNLDIAMSPSFYAASGVDSLAPVTDFHPVHGLQTSDGGYVGVGKGAEVEGGSAREAFAVKFSSSGALSWAWKSGVAGDDVANAVARRPAHPNRAPSRISHRFCKEITDLYLLCRRILLLSQGAMGVAKE